MEQVDREYTSIEDYIASHRMDQNCSWGTEVEIFAMAHLLSLPIFSYCISTRSIIHIMWTPHSLRVIMARWRCTYTTRHLILRWSHLSVQLPPDLMAFIHTSAVLQCLDSHRTEMHALWHLARWHLGKSTASGELQLFNNTALIALYYQERNQSSMWLKSLNMP